MTQFYDNQKMDNRCGRVANPQLVSALSMLPEYYSSILWKDIDYSIPLEKLSEKELASAFCGIYPKAFHHFSKYGIYVFRYFL